MSSEKNTSLVTPIIVIIQSGGHDIPRGGNGAGSTVYLYGSSAANATLDIKDGQGIKGTATADSHGAWKIQLDSLSYGVHSFKAGDRANPTPSDAYTVSYLAPPDKK